MCPSCATQEYVVLHIINAPWFATTSFISGESGHFSALDNPKGGFWARQESSLINIEAGITVNSDIVPLNCIAL